MYFIAKINVFYINIYTEAPTNISFLSKLRNNALTKISSSP